MQQRRLRRRGDLIALALLVVAFGGCQTPSTLPAPEFRPLSPEERDPTPLHAGPDQLVIDGIVNVPYRVPEIDVASGPAGELLVAWVDGESLDQQRIVASLVRGGTTSRAVLTAPREAAPTGIDAGFGADGCAVVAWGGDHLPTTAGLRVLGPQQAEWSEVQRIGTKGARFVTLDSLDARRLAVVSEQNTIRWRLLLDPAFYLVIMDREPLYGPESTVGSSEGEAGVQAPTLRPGVSEISRCGRWIAGTTGRGYPPRPPTVFAREVETGEETVLETDGRIQGIVVTACSDRPIVIWGDEIGLVASERGPQGWTPPVRIASTFVAALRAASNGDELLVTESSGGEVRAWMKRGERWSGPVRWSGWSGVPAFDGKTPVVFRVVDSAGEPTAQVGRCPVPTNGRLVRSVVTW